MEPQFQWKTPDDGQRNCPKHVEFRTRIKFGNYCVYWFHCKEICYDALSHERKIRIHVRSFSFSFSIPSSVQQAVTYLTTTSAA